MSLGKNSDDNGNLKNLIVFFSKYCCMKVLKIFNWNDINLTRMGNEISNEPKIETDYLH